MQLKTMANSSSIQFLLLITLLVVVFVAAQNGDCPSSTKVHTCAPRCFKDSDCATMGGKCCPDLCNQRSCVGRHLLTKFGDSSNTRADKYGPNKGTVYCGNVKCTAFEKCQVDRITKKEKCVRA